MAMNGTDNSSHRVNLFSHAVSKNQLEPGDHIYAYRAPVYRHHGIYIGEEDCEVIHFSGVSKSEARVRSCTLQKFCDGKQLRLVAYGQFIPLKALKRSDSCHILKSDPVQTVLQRAKQIRKNPHMWANYNLLFNNCEHFAVYCKTGRKYSSQSIGRVLSFFREIVEMYS